MEIILFLLVLGFFIYAYHEDKKKEQFLHRAQLSYIENYQFNSAIGKKVKNKYPHLTNAQVELVLDGLRDYFYICNKAKRKMVSMPSQVVDVAWHEFILFTRSYQVFCEQAFGYFLHHTPTEAMRTPTLAKDGIKRTWRIACAKSKINPSTPTRLPLLFAIDSMLSIEDGFKYSLNCKDGDKYCAGHIGCASGCVGDSGSSAGSVDSGDSNGGDGCGCGD